MKKALLMIVVLLCVVVQGTAKEPFTLWNECDVRDHADLAEGERRRKQWTDAGYTVISMKNDFKTIYGYGVVKTDNW